MSVGRRDNIHPIVEGASRSSAKLCVMVQLLAPPLHRPMREFCRAVRPELQRSLHPLFPSRNRVTVGDGWGRCRENGGREQMPGRVHQRRCRRRSHLCRWPCPGWPPKAAAVSAVLRTGRGGGGPGARKATPPVVPPPARYRGRARQLPRFPCLPGRYPLAMRPQLLGESSPVELSLSIFPADATRRPTS